jgi:putative lipoic acid-binding regulatory protein
MIEQETLLEFPCKFPIKAMGRADDDFEDLVRAIVLDHAELYPGEEVKAAASGEGNFISITVTVEATSRAQLDAIYQDLTACPRVLMAL